jgi:cytochrome c
VKRSPYMKPFAAFAAAAGIGIAAVSFASVEGALQGDPARGRTLYQGCEACHSLDDNDLGPKHRGVVGRRAGSVADYSYSPALKNSGLVWDETLLDRWLTNPSALVPGTKMFFQVSDAQNRADIIAFLKEQK